MSEKLSELLVIPSVDFKEDVWEVWAMGQLLIGGVSHRKRECLDERGSVSMNQVVRLEKTYPWEHCGEIASHSLSYSSCCAVSMAEIGFCSRIAALRLQKERSTIRMTIRSIGCR